nr:uncharacterized protein LOC120962421 [Aegilops tauschii subsp. strangulata]
MVLPTHSLPLARAPFPLRSTSPATAVTASSSSPRTGASPSFAAVYRSPGGSFFVNYTTGARLETCATVAYVVREERFELECSTSSPASSSSSSSTDAVPATSTLPRAFPATATPRPMPPL